MNLVVELFFYGLMLICLNEILNVQPKIQDIKTIKE